MFEYNAGPWNAHRSSYEAWQREHLVESGNGAVGSALLLSFHSAIEQAATEPLEIMTVHRLIDRLMIIKIIYICKKCYDYYDHYYYYCYCYYCCYY